MTGVFVAFYGQESTVRRYKVQYGSVEVSVFSLEFFWDVKIESTANYLCIERVSKPICQEIAEGHGQNLY